MRLKDSQDPNTTFVYLRDIGSIPVGEDLLSEQCSAEVVKLLERYYPNRFTLVETPLSEAPIKVEEVEPIEVKAEEVDRELSIQDDGKRSRSRKTEK